MLAINFSPLSHYITGQTKILISPQLIQYSTSNPSLGNKNPMQVPKQFSGFSNIHAKALFLGSTKGVTKYLAIG